jgi:hypothetical protein
MNAEIEAHGWQCPAVKCRPGDNGWSVAKDCRADLIKLPNDCSDCMTFGHRLLRVLSRARADHCLRPSWLEG